MKKLILLAFLSITILSCSQKLPTLISNTGGEYQVVVVDSCQYLFHGNSFTHKGNCNNPNHKK